jgi:[citrate (pro-3S)-lyase] ligase
MEVNCYETLSKRDLERRRAFLEANGLHPGDDGDLTVFVEEGGEILACGTRSGNIIKYTAVSPEARGTGITGTLFTALRRDAFEKGVGRLFIYTKPANRLLFEQSLFYPVEETPEVLLMESRKNGIKDFVDGIKAQSQAGGPAGAVVMNCDPFTLGHRYLVEKALEDCGRLYIFILSEDLGTFPAEDRLKLVKEGTADLENVEVCTTGGYLVSSATFPDYFLKRTTDSTEAQCALDCRIFARRFAPALDINVRYAGSEPLSAVTADYNRAMAAILPTFGIRFAEIPRLTVSGAPVSASKVRSLLGKGRPEELKSLVPETTMNYLISRGLV